MVEQKLPQESILKGLLGALTLLLIYFIIVTLISGWNFAQDQFLKFWYYILALSIGFGTQVGLYTYLKSSIQHKTPPTKVLAASGTTSGLAMISCCAHYLTNILPILGITGVITIISQYQSQLFWAGLAFNFAGITYMLKKVIQYKRSA